MKRSARNLAVAIIHSLQNQQSNLDALLKKHTKNLEEADRKHLQALCYGMCREWFHIEAIEQQLLDKPLKARDQVLSAIVRCGIYELGWMHTKPYAVVSEYVDATVIEGRPWARGLINAVLRQFIRRKSELKMERHTEEALWNHPAWFIEEVRAAWPDQWEQILVENNAHPPMTLRINRRKLSRDAYLKQLLDAGIDAISGSAPDSIRLAEPRSVLALPGFDDGQVSVQDESSQWAALALAPVHQERVLDACAAPGGKTCHLLEQADLHLVALDISEQRLTRVKENLVRLGLRAHLQAADASHVEGWWDEIPFDAILLDLPCSATGVIRRNPDVRLMRSEESLRALNSMQNMILDSTWTTLAEGGRMLVTTCSVLPRENQDLVKKFMSRHPEASLQSLPAVPGIDTGYGTQQFPSHHGGDGFYYALLVKSATQPEKASA